MKLEINGIAPDLTGKVCEALICEQYIVDGTLQSSASVTFLKLSGQWHRLCIDRGIIFWSYTKEDPKPWCVAEERWNYPHVDVAAAAGIQDTTLTSYEMSPTPLGSKVEFSFSNGRRIVIDDSNDVTSYVII